MRRGENIYYRKDERWEGRYVVGKKPNGKTKYKSVYGKTLQEVREKLYPLKVKYQIILREQGEVTLSFYEWGFQWLKEVQAGVKQSTYTNYEYKLVQYVLSEIGEYSLNELDEQAAEELLEGLKKRGFAPSMIQAVFRITKQCINLAIKKKLMKENPFTLIKLPKVVKKQNQALSKHEQKDLETVASEEKKGRGIPVLLALHAGLRIGEIAALTWDDLDFRSNVIHVRSTYQRVFSVLEKNKTELIYTDSKTASSVRSVPMSKLLKKVLLELKQASTSKYVVSSNNKPMEPRLLTYHFHQIRKAAGLPEIHFHQLRHTFATRCLESNGDIMSVSAMMGHRSTKMTLDTYAGSNMEQCVLVVEQMEKTIA
ncbi:tyrosine-type recombinase/integrase [Enterococcus sp. 669A]|uniref:Tyrosine-type recombinase/integrase n=1 Tax=Candidatus Enterococcus moelleringii TaxID=2815325 RepID=A0ABS3LFX1_9ENTE|nr:site-specific integrase [Enterococcus sp. 669A]MBO1308544.1 tyrosine-type recombinase/integrase [Enterococcus sp. 669A]